MSKPSDPTIAQIGSQSVLNDTKDDTPFDAASFEQSNVHNVYEAIAPHFSDTRYKPWPLIPAFINSLPAGSIGADLGCGNGKYLHLRNILAPKDQQNQNEQKVKKPLKNETLSNDILMLGMDRSSNLIDLAHHNFDSIHTPESIDQQRFRNEVAVGDAMRSNFRSGCFDFAISIATIHHFASFQRRIEAVAEMIRIIQPCQDHIKDFQPQITIDQGIYAGLRSGSGRFLIIVWALEQRGESRRQFEQVATSKEQQKSIAEEAQNTHQGQDLMVPWILKDAYKAKVAKNSMHQKETSTKQSEQSNVEEQHHHHHHHQQQQQQQTSPEIFQRFYHVFEQGELEKTVDEAAKLFPGLVLQQELGGWEKGNWFGVWRCVKR